MWIRPSSGTPGRSFHHVCMFRASGGGYHGQAGCASWKRTLHVAGRRIGAFHSPRVIINECSAAAPKFGRDLSEAILHAVMACNPACCGVLSVDKIANAALTANVTCRLAGKMYLVYLRSLKEYIVINSIRPQHRGEGTSKSNVH